MKAELAILLAGGAALASAQQTQWGQCGGIGWTGPTTCVSGSTCTYSNAYYSQCLPGAAGTTTKATTTAAATRTTISSSTTSVRTQTTTSSKAATTTATGTTKFQYFGTNESGGEFGNLAIPGQLGKDYTWPSPSSIDYFVSNGFNTFRVGTMMERIAPPTTGGVTGSFNETYMSGLDTIVNYITGKGAYAIIDVHNYGRYQGNIITSTSDFQTFWTHLAARYKSNTKVIFDTNNEYHDMDETLVFGLNQAAINGIRAAGATSQLILVEGNSYTGAWTWISSGNAASLINLKDPNNNFAYEMHQYLDSDGSGTSATCVSSTIFAERIQAATNWCKTNNVKCFLGEIGAGTDSVCQAALKGGFTAMQASGVWIGALWWAAGPWWGTYYQSIEPSSGPANAVIVPLLKSFQ